MQNLGSYDRLRALCLPAMFAGLGTFYMRQYFFGLPAEYADAVRTDGASEWVIFHRIYFPKAVPVLSALGILSFVWSWKDYESPLFAVFLVLQKRLEQAMSRSGLKRLAPP